MTNNFQNRQLLTAILADVIILRRKASKVPHRHRILVNEMLAWRTPFMLTEQRQKIIDSQQFNQRILDTIIPDLKNVLNELNKLYIAVPNKPSKQ